MLAYPENFDEICKPVVHGGGFVVFNLTTKLLNIIDMHNFGTSSYQIRENQVQIQ